MGTDKRITDLTALSDAQVIALLASLVLEMDDPSLSAGETQKVPLSQLLSNRDVPDNTTIAHKAVTEQGLMKTVATYLKKGVVRLATTQDIDAESASVALSPDAMTYWLARETAENYYNDANESLIYDHAFPTALSFTPSLSVTTVGNLVMITGGFLIAWGGSVSQFEIWLKSETPSHPSAASVTMNDGSTYRSCGAIVESRNGFTVLTVHMPQALSNVAVYVNVTYPR